MKALKFRLSGENAFFKKPEVNSYVYFTYGNIHKVALLGMFGAILGYSGYNKFRYNIDNVKGFNADYPEFYEKLKDLKIAIEPLNERGIISKKVQIFNNSVGYASQEEGGNLVVKEQWLEKPEWNIYLLINCEEAEKIKNSIENHKAVYQPYLGKNDHYANISDIETLELEKIKKDGTLIEKIDTLCPREYITFRARHIRDNDFKYCEKLPVGLNKDSNMYVLESLIYSNIKVESVKINDNMYKSDNKNIVFI